MKENGRLTEPTVNGGSKNHQQHRANGRHANGGSSGHQTETTGSQEQELLDTESCVLGNFDTYEEERVSIDLKEGSYHKS